MPRNSTRGRAQRRGQRVYRSRAARQAQAQTPHLFTTLQQCLPWSLCLDEVLQAIPQGAAQLCAATAASLWGVDEATATLCLYTTWGEPLEPASLPSTLSFQQDAMGWVARHRQALVVADVLTETRFVPLEHWHQRGLQSLAGFPILLEDTLYAVLVLHARRPFTFTPTQQALLTFFLAHVRSTLHNARLYTSENTARQATESSLYAQATMAVRSASLYATETMARTAMAEATRAKNALLANMSHELRTPLNAIINYSEILLEDAEAQGHLGYGSDLRKIHLAGKHLLARINDILDFVRMEAGDVHVRREMFDLPCLLQDILDTLKPLMVKNANTLEVHVANDVTMLYGDREKIQQALLHLLSNATKFTSQGRIELTVSHEYQGEQPWICFQVRDTGIGMSPDQVARLFQPFMQADDSLTRKYGGTGMGLAVSQRLCHMMGGEITVTSTVGQGSTFTMYVPALGHATQLAHGER